MTTDPPSNPRESSREVAEDLRTHLEAVADSDLPFAYDAQQILDQLESEGEES